MEQANGRKRYLPEKRAEIMKQYLLEKNALSNVVRWKYATMVSLD